MLKLAAGTTEPDAGSVVLSGEKAPLAMPLMLNDPLNFLVLNEPTNHLDIATKKMLIGALAAYGGMMLFVSHDRYFRAALSNESVGADAGGYPSVWRWVYEIRGADRAGRAQAACLKRLVRLMINQGRNGWSRNSIWSFFEREFSWHIRLKRSWL